jgi:predicted nucleotidyltransferase
MSALTQHTLPLVRAGDGLSVQSILDQLGTASEEPIAVMLYGSCARGTADQQSDVDILELVSRSPSPREVAGANVTQYLPSGVLSN